MTPKNGIVISVHCVNVYDSPNPHSDILGILAPTSSVLVYVDASTNEFYRVCNPWGLEGYVPKDTIKIEGE